MGQKERPVDTNNLSEDKRARLNRKMLRRRRRTEEPTEDKRVRYDVLSLNGSGRCRFDEIDDEEDDYSPESFA